MWSRHALASAIALIGFSSARAVVLPQGYQVQDPSTTITVAVQTNGAPAGNLPQQNLTQATTVHTASTQTQSATSSPGATAPGDALSEGTISLGGSPYISTHNVAETTALTGAGYIQNGFAGYGLNNASTNVQLYYFMAVSGPNPTVNLNVDALLGASSALGLYGSAQVVFSVQRSNSSYLLRDNVYFASSDPYSSINATGDNYTTPFAGQYHDKGTYTFDTGKVYTIGLFITTQVTSWGSPYTLGAKQDVSDFIDPVFTIDPSTPNVGDYQLIFSQGIHNVAAVPEPGAAQLALAGLGLLGWMARRKCA